MMGPKSWSEDYFGAEPVVREPVAPLYVEFWMAGGWDVWQEVEWLEDAEELMEALEDKAYAVRIRDAENVVIRESR